MEDKNSPQSSETNQPRPLLEGQQQILDNLQHVLEEASPGWIEIHKEKTFTVLLPACGAAQEVPAIRSLFPNANIVGIDQDPNAILMANMPGMRGLYKLCRGDAGSPESYVDEQGRELNAELILLRNPNITPENAAKGGNWDRVVTTANNQLTTNGLFVVSVSRPADEELMKSVMQRNLLDPSAHIPVTLTTRETLFSESRFLVATKK